jgi:hypothetical protein
VPPPEAVEPDDMRPETDDPTARYERYGLPCPRRHRVPARSTVGFMAAPPASTTTSLGQRPAAQATANWPELVGVQVRFRANFAYVEGHLADGEVVPVCRLRYAGSASRWGFALYRASHDDYEDNFFPSGHTADSRDEALDCACGLYITDRITWPPDPSPTD